MKILNPSEVVLDRITYSAPSQIKGKGGKVIYVGYLDDDGEKVPLVIRTPLLGVPWGIKSWDQRKYVCDMAMPDTIKGKEFSTLISTIDDRIINDSARYSKEWLNVRSPTVDVLFRKYRRSIKVMTDEDGNPVVGKQDTLRLKVPYVNDIFQLTGVMKIIKKCKQ